MACTERAFTVSGGQVTLGAVLSGYKYEYDANNNLTKLICAAAGSAWDTIYTYDKDNRTVTTTFANGKVLTVTYDAISRVTKRRLGLTSNYDTDLTYVPGYDGSQTALLSTYQNGSDDAYEYTYDDNGNITSITRGSTFVTYQHNGANELIRENNQFTNQTVTYAYDVWGNLTAKSVYAYTTAENPGTPISTISYGYSTGDWKDQLISYGNQTIVYDAMGNPTTYRGKALTWRGKQLTGIADGTDTIAYSYDENGLRLQKTVNNVVTDYYYNGKVLIGLVKENDTLRFSYDAAGNAAAVNHNGTYYYYLRNGQGDIVKLIDGSKTTVVEYTYDSWGKPLSCTGTLATTLGALNPFRYRGYVYDEETQWYYLKSRYYDPETCRFISADVLLSTGQGVIGHNAFAYCRNNPITRKDKYGKTDEETNLDTDLDEFLRYYENTYGIGFFQDHPNATHLSVRKVEYEETKWDRLLDDFSDHPISALVGLVGLIFPDKAFTTWVALPFQVIENSPSALVITRTRYEIEYDDKNVFTADYNDGRVTETVSFHAKDYYRIGVGSHNGMQYFDNKKGKWQVFSNINRVRKIQIW